MNKTLLNQKYKKLKKGKKVTLLNKSSLIGYRITITLKNYYCSDKIIQQMDDKMYFCVIGTKGEKNAKSSSTRVGSQ